MNNTLNPFLDERKIPKIGVNIKVKVKTNTPEEYACWNRAFGYIMKKPRTKLEFLTVSAIRKLKIDNLQLSDIKDNISPEDYTALSEIEEIFNERLTIDTKSFILAMLRIQVAKLEEIIKNKPA